MSFEVPVTVALPSYHHSQEIRSGAVALAGMAPDFVAPGTAGADIVEQPLSEYVQRRVSGDESLTAVPVYPARAFVHSWIQVPGGAGVPLETSSAGNPTADIYARGLLSDRGEDLADIVVTPGRRPGLRPLFEPAGEFERADYRASGVYPILSVIAIRSELLARERWLATNVYRAFEISRRRYFGRLQDIRGSRVPIPSIAGHLSGLRELFGPDLWSHGLEAGRATLTAFLRHAADQGVITQAPDDPAVLFADVEPFVDYTDGL